MVKVEIVNDRIIPFPADNDRTDEGSELTFNGRVRSIEDDKEITDLEYEQYDGMTEKELKIIAEETINKFSVHDLFCKHRVGKVKVGEKVLLAFSLASVPFSDCLWFCSRSFFLRY